MDETLIEITLDETVQGLRLDKALARIAPEAASLSRSRLGKLIESEAVCRSDGTLGTLKTKAEAGEVWRINVPKPADLEARPEAIPLDVVYEDDALIVVNKPAGMVVHPAPGSETGTLVNALLHHCVDSLSGIGGAKRPGIVHRIDKDTSGLLVVAKTDKAHQGLAVQFADHSITRDYDALCHGVPTAADPRLRGLPGVGLDAGGLRIATNIARHKTDRKRMAVTANAGRHAVTRMKVTHSFGTRAARISCRLETGRTHQIRVHMAHIGHPLIGDPVYGGRRKLSQVGMDPDDQTVIESFARQALHARSLGFVHPENGSPMDFEAPLPPDFQAVLACLDRSGVS